MTVIDQTPEKFDFIVVGGQRPLNELSAPTFFHIVGTLTRVF
jgi:hypothetical protein